MPTTSALHIYPIKSCRGLDLKALRFDHLGPFYDRRFMLIDENGEFITQRKVPQLARIEPQLGPMALQVKAPNMPVLKVAMSDRDPKRREVTVWGNAGVAEDAGENAAAWFSEFLEQRVRLVRAAPDSFREIDRRYAPRSAPVGLFADGFPALLISEASLDDLNSRLSEKLPMNRFRPNIVVRDCEPYEEDRWKRIRIGELVLDVVKPCKRCTITTVDQVTGKFAGEEPLKTLATYRKHENGAIFGQNCMHEAPGALRVGDEVEVLERA